MSDDLLKYVEIPLPPSVNSSYQRYRNGAVHLSRVASEYKERAAWLALSDSNPHHDRTPYGSLPVFVVVAARVCNGSRDLDNMFKLPQDALEGILWDNDRLIHSLHIARFAVKSKPSDRDFRLYATQDFALYRVVLDNVLDAANERLTPSYEAITRGIGVLHER